LTNETTLIFVTVRFKPERVVEESKQGGATEIEQIFITLGTLLFLYDLWRTSILYYLRGTKETQLLKNWSHCL
jgi:hypothetical protein